MAKGTKYSKQFKEDIAQYRLDHLELAFHKATEKLEVSGTALKHWMRTTKEHKSKVPIRDSGNYTSDQAKEITRL